MSEANFPSGLTKTMTSNDDYQEIKHRLEDALKIVQSILEQFKQQQQQISTEDILLENSILNVNANTFLLDIDNDQLMETLTRKIEMIFNNCLPNLSQNYQEYIYNFLCEYHYNLQRLKFKQNLTMNILYVFLNDLEAIRDSFDAFQAAWKGDLSNVKEFINKYPAFKDKPGPWGTTLLYSAARTNCMPLVEYLVTEAQCSVNAQNQQHIEKALLKDTITDPNYQVSPKAGSTALHAACFGGYLEIVKYLIEHGANYFIRNQAEETPIMNGEIHEHIIEYFQKFLNLGYTKQVHSRLSTPIIEGTNQLIKDCIWEYKSFSDSIWLRFDTDASNELNKSLIVEPDQQFKQEIYITMSSVIYTVSTFRFLRSGRDQDQNEDLAWIRCRGSSILNFDCYAIWQILLIKHPRSKSDNETCLEPMDLSTIEDQTSEIQLGSWYNCDAKTNSLLDQAMNTRRRYTTLCVDGLSDDTLQFDLMGFSFNNKQNTISGFLRWIPKLVSNNELNKHRITRIDNFQTLTNLEPIPLTTKCLKEVSQATHNKPIEQESIDDIEDEEYQSSNNLNTDDDPYDEDEKDKKVNQEQLLSLFLVLRQTENVKETYISKN